MRNFGQALAGLFLLILPFLMLANNGIFSYTTSGSIPTATQEGRSYSITFSIKTAISLSEPLSVQLSPLDYGFSLENHCDKPLAKGDGCLITVNFTPEKTGRASSSLVVAAGDLPIINQSFSTTVGNLPGHFEFKDASSEKANQFAT